VYALVRDEAKAAALRRDEIIPVIGDLSKPETYAKHVKEAAVIVDNVMDHNGQPGQCNSQLLELAVLSSTAEHAWRQKKTFIYTSGILVYGDHPGEVVDETTPIPPYPMVQWRIDHEKQVVGQDKLNGVVIRPGFVYGHSGSLSAPLFKAAGDTLVIKGKREKRWSWVHVEDLAQAYVLAVQKIHVAKGEVFNIVSPSSPTWEELNLSAAKLVGFTGKVDYQPPGDQWWDNFMDVTVVASHKKASDLLGWQPQHLGIMEELPLLHEAIKAHQ
jgi:nucleoside-diphosphate-sugar epimerase